MIRHPLIPGLIVTALAAAGVPAHAGVLWANDDRGNLFTVDISTGQATLVGNSGLVLNDIAWDAQGNLYGIDYDYLYAIDPADASLTALGAIGEPVVALVVDEAGTLWAAGSSLLRLNPGTGHGTSFCDLGDFSAAGDLALDIGGNLYVTTSVGYLLKIDRADASVTTVGPIPDHDVYGFARNFDGTLYGITWNNMLMTIDPLSGQGTYIRQISGDFLGGTFGSSFTDEAVPEPAGLALIALGSLALLRRRSHRRP